MRTVEQTSSFHNDAIGLAWLREDAVRARQCDAIGILTVVVASDRDDWNVARAAVRSQPLAQLDTVDTGDCDVGENQIGRLKQCLFERLVAVVRLIDATTVTFQCNRVEVTRPRIVLHDEHERRGAGHLSR